MPCNGLNPHFGLTLGSYSECELHARHVSRKTPDGILAGARPLTVGRTQVGIDSMSFGAPQGGEMRE